MFFKANELDVCVRGGWHGGLRALEPAQPKEKEKENPPVGCEIPGAARGVCSELLNSDPALNRALNLSSGLVPVPHLPFSALAVRSSLFAICVKATFPSTAEAGIPSLCALPRGKELRFWGSALLARRAGLGATQKSRVALETDTEQQQP